jgi:hypothetical protein
VPITSGQSSYQSEAQKVINAHPQVIFTELGSPTDAGVLFNNLKELNNLAIPVVGTDSTATPDWLKAITIPVAETHLTSITAATLKTPSYGAFLKATLKTFHHQPRDSSSNAYDAVIISALAMDAAKSTTSSRFVKKISVVTKPGGSKCSTYKSCLAKLHAGKKVQYVGAGGPTVFSSDHQIGAAFQAVVANTAGVFVRKTLIPPAEVSAASK